MKASKNRAPLAIGTTLLLMLLVFSSSAFAGITAATATGTGVAACESAMTSLAEEDAAYCDRTHQYESIPAYLLGGDWVQVANDDRTIADYNLAVTTDVTGYLYVIWDNRNIASLPAWLSTAFTDTGDDMDYDESADGDVDQTASVFRSNSIIAAGVTNLGAQNLGTTNMYGVAFEEVSATYTLAITDVPDPVAAGAETGGLIHTLDIDGSGDAASSASITWSITVPAGVTIDSTDFAATCIALPFAGFDGPSEAGENSNAGLDSPSGAVLFTGPGTHQVFITANRSAVGGCIAVSATMTVGPTAIPGSEVISSTATITGIVVDGTNTPITNTNTDPDPTEPTSIDATTASWRVQKIFADGGGGTADISMTCTNGDVNGTGTTTATETVSGGGFGSFNVQGFLGADFGGTNCWIHEDTPPAGYYPTFSGASCNVASVANDGSYLDCVVTNNETYATIKVYKDFNDGNPSEIIAHLDCNDGLIPDQPQNVAEGFPASFVLTKFTSGALDCEVTEEPIPGYETSYSVNNEVYNSVSCEYLDIFGGEAFECYILNEVIPIDFDVRKVWFDEHPEFKNSLYARASYECTGESPAKPIKVCKKTAGFVDCGFGNGYHGALWFEGMVDDDDFDAWPHWNGETTCTVSERVRDSSVESDDSDCYEVPVLLGQDKHPSDDEWECTIYNTRIYEGVPTLSQYGLALLALLMLGVGMVGFRRFS